MKNQPVPHDLYMNKQQFTEKIQQKAVSRAEKTMGVSGRDYVELVTSLQLFEIWKIDGKQ